MSTTLEPRTTTPSELRQAQHGVLRRLVQVRKRLRTHLLVEGIFWTLAAIVLSAGTSLLLDRLLRFNLATRLALASAAVAAIVYIAFTRLARPLCLTLHPLDLAQILDRRHRGVGQQISNVLQLPDLLGDERMASSAMVHATVLDCVSSLDRVDFSGSFNVERRRKLLAGCAALLALLLGFCAAWPEVAGLWARRWLAGSNVRWPQQNYLNVVGLGDDGTLLVPRGEISLLELDAHPRFVEADGRWRLSGRGEDLWIEANSPPQSAAPEQVSITYILADGSKRRGNATQFDERNFRYDLPPLVEPATLHVTAGDDWLGPIVIEPIDRPTVRQLEIISRQPGASQPQTHRVGEASEPLLFLPQTELQLRLVADAPLQSATVLDKGAAVAGWRRLDERSYGLSWTMQESLAFEFRLVGARGNLSSKPYFLAIGLLKDREPRVTIRSSGVGRRVTPVARIPLAMRAGDDFGVASLALDWEKTELRDEKSHTATQHDELEKIAEGASPARIDWELDHEFLLRDRSFVPGNTLKIRASAVDNCVLGAQGGNSRWLLFQIVSPEELFYEILMRQREQRAKFSTATDSAKEQIATLTALANPADALAVARMQQIIARQVWQVANQLDASLQEMTLNDLGNSQARDMLQSAIITPLRTLHQDLMGRLRAAIDAVATAPTVDEERRLLARTLADEQLKTMQGILAQMAQWESFVDVINQVKAIIERQEQVLKSTEEVQKKRTESIFEE